LFVGQDDFLSYGFLLNCLKMDIVECHSGFTYAEKPLAFIWQGKRQHLVNITAQGYTPHVRWFRVITLDQQVFKLSCNEDTDAWTIRPI
jgi:hypothetical protein